MQTVAWNGISQRWNASSRHQQSPDVQKARFTDQGEDLGSFADDAGQSPTEGRAGGKLFVSPLNAFSERFARRPHSAASTPRRLHYGYDNAIFGAVQRQIEALETRVTRQINKAQQEGDQQVSAALEQLEEQLQKQRIVSESLEPRLGRRFAEVNGQMKGIVEELQSLIMRTNALDSRFWDWRHELDDGMQQKLAVLQQQLEAVASDRDATNSFAEEVRQNLEQRLQNTERLLEEHVLIADLQPHDRHLQKARGGTQPDEVAQPSSVGEKADKILPDAGDVWKCEQRWAETMRRFEVFQGEVNTSEARMKAHDVRMNLVLERLEGLEKRYRALSDRAESQSIERHLEQFRQASDGLAELALKVDKQAQEMVELAAFVYSGDGIAQEHEELVLQNRQTTRHLPFVVTDGRQDDEHSGEVSDYLTSFQAPLGVLSTRLDEAVAKVEEHERCTRVLLCDVLPRVGELSDARDQVRDALVTMEDRIAAAEANMQLLQSANQEAW